MKHEYKPELRSIPPTHYDCQDRGPEGECNYNWGTCSHYSYCIGVRMQVFGDWPNGGCPRGFP